MTWFELLGQWRKLGVKDDNYFLSHKGLFLWKDLLKLEVFPRCRVSDDQFLFVFLVRAVMLYCLSWYKIWTINHNEINPPLGSTELIL